MVVVVVVVVVLWDEASYETAVEQIEGWEEVVGEEGVEGQEDEFGVWTGVGEGVGGCC